MQKKLLILCYSKLSSDPRVQRQISAMAHDFEVSTCGLSDAGDPKLPFYSIYKEPPFSLPRKLRRLAQFMFRRYERYYWDDYKKNLAATLKAHRYDVVIANDIPTLPLALAIAGDTGIVYFDAHEYHPKEFEESFKWRIMHKPYVSFLCKTYIPKARLFSTVAEGIAQQYEAFTGCRPFVITNATGYRDLRPSPTDPQKIRLIHHGAALRARKTEIMIDMVNLLDERFYLDLMLVDTDKAYYRFLKEKAGQNPRIGFIPPVHFSEICPFINRYDCGIYLLQPANFNFLHAFPNKLFEFMQARLGIIVSPNPEIAGFVKEHRLGIVCGDYEPATMAKQINSLTADDIRAFKLNADKAAAEESSEKNEKKIRSMILAALPLT